MEFGFLIALGVAFLGGLFLGWHVPQPSWMPGSKDTDSLE